MAEEHRKEEARRRREEAKAGEAELKALLVSVRDFIETHKEQKYYKGRWAPWQHYINRINMVV